MISKPMKIILINPPINNSIDTEVPLLVKQNEGVFPSLGLLYIASYLDKHVDCKIEILDCLAKKMSHDAIKQFIYDFCPDIVGITAHTHNLIDVILVAESIKMVNRNIYVCLGGPHVNAFPWETMSIGAVDFAILGEGEVAFTELIKAIQVNGDLGQVGSLLFKRDGKIIGSEKKASIEDLDSLPFPVRWRLNYKDYYSILGNRTSMTTMISSRGCPYQCIFCSTPKGFYRKRSPENVVDEIAECISLGIEEVHFIDDTFNVDYDRVIKICDEIKRRRLKIKWSFRGRIDKITKPLLIRVKEAGCCRIHLGVETSSDEGLRKLMKELTVEQIKKVFKWVRETKINTVAYFLIGCPHEKSRAEVEKTIDFSREIDPDFALFNILAPYPETELYAEGLKKGVLKANYWKEFALNPRKDFRIPFWEEWLSKGELVSLLNLAYRRFYIRPKFMLRAIRSSLGSGSLMRRIKTGLEIFKLPLKRC